MCDGVSNGLIQPEFSAFSRDNSRRNRWCGRGDSNPHALASVSPSSWCVCQFRHFRKSPLQAGDKKS